jgi:hypothetical protein
VLLLSRLLLEHGKGVALHGPWTPPPEWPAAPSHPGVAALRPPCNTPSMHAHVEELVRTSITLPQHVILMQKKVLTKFEKQARVPRGPYSLNIQLRLVLVSRC